jgi:Fe-S oxidoreductase
MADETMWEEYITSLYTCRMRMCRYCQYSNNDCKPVCPMKERYGFSSYSSSGMVMIARALQDGTLNWEPEIADVVYNCTMCKACSIQCGNIYYLTNEYFNVPMLVEKLREELINRGKVPPTVRDYLKSVDLFGNPYQKPGAKRGQWAEGLGIPTYSGQEFLFYVGDVGSFDERGMKTAQTVGSLLIKNEVSIGILGSKEISDGNEVKALGEQGLFEVIAGKNIALFNKLGVKKIITLSPHGYNTMKNEYPKMGGTFEVLHYTQILDKLIGKGKLVPPQLKANVTYHDPCYLGRHNKEYEIPRKILKSVPGVKLVEMTQVKEEAFCCGGGGGNFFTSMLGSGVSSPSRIRIRQAFETGAEVLAVACPLCAKMLEDAVKDEGLEEKLKVKDIAEIVSGTSV